MALIRASNTQLTTGKERTWLTKNATAGDSTVTVKDYASFSVSQYVLIGDFGNERSEVVKIHASTAPTSAGVITFATNLVYDHSIDDRVTQIDYNQVEFSRATTTTGTKTVLTTSNIEADDQYTTYNDLTDSTGYAFIRFYNATTAVFSSYSSAIAYTGLGRSTVRAMKDAALKITGSKISDLVTEDFLLTELNNWQDEISEQKDWSYELTSTTDTIVSGQQGYDLPTSPASFKYFDSSKAILTIRIKNYDPLEYVDKEEYDQLMSETVSTTLSAAISSTSDTTVSLTDAGDFSDAGTILIGDGSADEITYTAKSTNTLTGVDDITTTHSLGATVWQTSSLGKPVRYTIYDNQIYFQPVASSTYEDLTIHYSYWQRIPELTDDADTTPIPFFYLAQYYLAWKIESMKTNKDQADYWRQIYENRLARSMRRNRDRQPARFIPLLSGLRPRH